MLQRDDGTYDPRYTKREFRGLDPLVHRIRWPEVYGHFDPDALRSDESPPPEVQSQLEDVFGDLVRGKTPQVKLRLHPWFRRWALFERDGVGDWHCFWVCGAGEGEIGHLPADLYTPDKRYIDLAHGPAVMGSFRVPNKEDFAGVWAFRGKRWDSKDEQSTAERMEAHLGWREKAVREHQSQMEQREADAMDYYGLDLYAMANQQRGSGQRPYSTSDSGPQVDLKMTSDRYLNEPVTDADGRVLYVRRTKITAAMNEALAAKLEERAHQRAALGAVSRPAAIAYSKTYGAPGAPEQNNHNPLVSGDRTLGRTADAAADDRQRRVAERLAERG